MWPIQEIESNLMRFCLRTMESIAWAQLWGLISWKLTKWAHLTLEFPQLKPKVCRSKARKILHVAEHLLLQIGLQKVHEAPKSFHLLSLLPSSTMGSAHKVIQTSHSWLQLAMSWAMILTRPIPRKVHQVESLAKMRLMEMELSTKGVRSNRQVVQVPMEIILLCLSTKVALRIPVVWRFLMPVRGQLM